MIRSNSDTTTSTSSPTPVSPFSSNYSVPSEPTSDEVPDLGQFTAVLRAWNHLQPFPRNLHPAFVSRQEFTTQSSRTRSFPTISSEIESDDQRQPRSTVWAHRPIASYLASGDFTTDTETDRERENRPPLISASISTRVLRRISAQRTRRSDDEPDADVEDDDDYSDARATKPRMVQIEDLDELDSTFGHDLYDDDETNNNSKELKPVEPGSLDLKQLQLNEESEQSTGFEEEVDEQPSLGYLDEALRFIVAERERWKAQREAGFTNGSTLEPRRKRRRKRKTPRAHSTTRASTTSTNLSSLTSASSLLASSSTPSLLSTIFQSSTVRDEGEDGDADDSSSSYDHRYSSSSPQVATRLPLFKSSPTTPRKGGKNPQRQHNPKLKHSTSTPQLRPPSPPVVVEEDNPRIHLLKSLGKKLEKLFPEDRRFLRTVGYGTLSASSAPGDASYFDAFSGDDVGVGVLGNFVDTRGTPPPKKIESNEERIIHVFVDHSNILIGLLNFLKRHPRQHPQYHELLQNSSGGNNASGNLSSPAYPKPPKHLSHSALTLVLERGRPVSRRVLVTSSPLYQPMDSAELLGFEVRVFARVPDLGDGIDRERDRQRPGNGHRRTVSSGSFTSHNQYSGVASGGGQDLSSSPKKGRKRSGSVNNGMGTGSNSFPPPSNNRKRGHQRGFSAGGGGNGSTSAESEHGASANAPGNTTFPQAFLRSLGAGTSNGNGTPSIMNMLSSSVPTSNVSTPPVSMPGQATRVRYREQGVDELLQLKLHQALASIDGPPPQGSTIILATGDGNAGQFNEDGFLGSVRTALKRGWKVELYAWEGGLSKAWKREFGKASEWGARGGDDAKFKVIGMEQFGSELVEIYF